MALGARAGRCHVGRTPERRHTHREAPSLLLELRKKKGKFK